MKAHQLQKLQQQHSGYLRRETQVEKPNATREIRRALLDGSPIKLRTEKELIELLRERVANDRHSDYLNFGDVFTCPRTREQEAAYKKAEEAMTKKRATYERAARKILRDAELNPEANAIDCADALEQAAINAGLIEQ